MPNLLASRACSTIIFKSLTPLPVADNSLNSAFVSLAIIAAKVVFPLPGGPQKIKDGTLSFFIDAKSRAYGPTTRT